MTDEERAHELSAIAAAIGSCRFMDPPDGGDVSLAEQVTRMRKALEKAEAALAQSDAEPDPTKVICPNCAHQFGAISVADQERLRASRPDASAGLSEAAEIAETIANSDEVEPWVERAVLRSFAKLLRARAADRSEK